MEWRKDVGRRAGTEGGWREDFPLNHQLPETVRIDCSKLELPIHPMFLVRLRTFFDWHHSEGRNLGLVPPIDRGARDLIGHMGTLRGLPFDPYEGEKTAVDDVVLPVTRLSEFNDVEAVAGKAVEILSYQLTDVSALGQATYMAVSELCGNAVEHGRNAHGAYIAALRLTEPRRQVAIAISDLGVGIPEHVRQRYPEWAEDAFAIARALEPGISGVDHPHRGNGFEEMFQAALTSSLHAARIDVHSANGFVRTHIFDDRRRVETFPAASFRRGTWISYDLTSV